MSTCTYMHECMLVCLYTYLCVCVCVCGCDGGGVSMREFRMHVEGLLQLPWGDAVLKEAGEIIRSRVKEKRLPGRGRTQAWTYLPAQWALFDT